MRRRATENPSAAFKADGAEHKLDPPPLPARPPRLGVKVTAHPTEGKGEAGTQQLAKFCPTGPSYARLTPA